MKLRESGDIPAVKSLHKKIFPKDEFPENCTHWIAWNGFTPVGFCSAKIVDGEDTVFFARAGVINSARGQGLHRRMIRVRESWARKRAANAVTYCLYSNHESLASLIKNGWRLYSPARKWAGEVNYLKKHF